MDKPDSISHAVVCLWSCVAVYLSAMAISFIVAPRLAPTVYFFSPLCAGLAAAGIGRGKRIAARILNVLGSVYAIVAVMICLHFLLQWRRTDTGEAFFWFVVYASLSGLWIAAIWMLNLKESTEFFRRQSESSKPESITKNGLTTIVCPYCQTKCEGSPDLIGKGIDCPSCGKRFVVRGDNHVVWSKQRVVGLAIASAVILSMGAGIWIGARATSDENPKADNLVEDIAPPNPRHEVKQDSLSALTGEMPEAKTVPKQSHKENAHHAVVNDLNNIKEKESDQFVLSCCVTVETLFSRGTGILYRLQNGNLFVITCRHVVEDGFFALIKDINGRTINLRTNETAFVDQQNIKVYFSNDRDMALISVEEPSFPVRCFNESTRAESVSIGQKIDCYGDSQGIGVVVKSHGKVLGIGPIQFEIDADIVPGNSGGPIVLHESGKVVGIASAASKDPDVLNQGTRFENAVRRFGIRFDTINWKNLSTSFTPYDKLYTQNNYHALFLLAAKEECEGSLERASLMWLFGKQRDARFATQYDTMFLNPKFSQYNPEKGISLLQEDANRGNVWAQYALGEYYEKYKNYKLSFRWYKKAADNNFGSAMLKVGEFFETGKGTSIDGIQALEYYSKQGDQSPLASFRIGVLCEEGVLVPQDMSRAFISYLKASSASWVEEGLEGLSYLDPPLVAAVCESRYRLARLLQQGKGCQKNLEEAKHWLEKSRSMGDPSGQAAYALAVLTEEETGSIDASLLEEAVQKGYKDAVVRTWETIKKELEEDARKAKEKRVRVYKTDAPSKSASNEPVTVGKSIAINLGGGVKLEMVNCPGVSSNFWMGKFEVTQEQWQRVMGKNPSFYVHPRQPVERIKWNDCQDLVKKLNALAIQQSIGLTFRLPNVEEWKKACRAGAPKREPYCKLKDGTQITASSLSRVAKFMTFHGNGPAPVGSLEPNAWGLYDMHGNVSEWTDSSYGTDRISCGGDCYSTSDFCTADIQEYLPPDKYNRTVGVRIAAEGMVLGRKSR